MTVVRIFASADESNWRNDYPDEESGGPGSSESEEDFGHSSASYRHREAYYGVCGGGGGEEGVYTQCVCVNILCSTRIPTLVSSLISSCTVQKKQANNRCDSPFIVYLCI